MSLQTMFALYSLLPAITASPVVPSTTSPTSRSASKSAATIRNTPAARQTDGFTRTSVTVLGGRRFTATLFTPTSGSAESRYPGALIIATEETRDRAFNVAATMSAIGVTVIMYTQEPYSTRRLLMRDAYAAIDSIRHRYDVRREEIGIIAFEEATVIVPDLVRDTSLSFAIAASQDPLPRYVNPRYTVAHAATLLVQGVDSLKDTGPVTQKDATNVAAKPRDPMTAGPAMTLPPGMQSPFDQMPPPAEGSIPSDQSAELSADSIGAPSDSLITEIIDAAALSAPTRSMVPPNITVWPVPKSQLATIGEAQSPLGVRVVSWLREQVHANPIENRSQPIVIRQDR